MFEYLLNIYSLLGGVILLYMTVLYGIALVRKDNSIADIAWGPGFLLAALTALWYGGEVYSRSVLVTGLVAVWALRLSVRIWKRNRGRGEDPRYQKWRKDWGKNWLIMSFLQVFFLQGLLLLIVVSPAVLVNTSGFGPFGLLDVIGLTVWLIGFYFETVGDAQLDSFLADPANKGKIMDKGLWRFSRHPNYFGEATMWWGLFLIALNVPNGWVSIIGPIVITYLLLFVSGVPLTERMMAGNPEFEEYKKKTSVFFPWPPKE